MAELKRIMVANRGEIALRIIRTIKEMGKTAIAIYSEADLMSPHARLADEAYFLGSSVASESYLNIDKIIKIAKENNIDGIHPGYGFLSENAKFSQAVSDAGIEFIGPSPQAISVMGDKIESKKTVSKHNVPLLPGSEQSVESVEEGKKIANEIGYPVLIKASAGGGGKGMRIVDSENQLEEQMERAVSEARSAFGDGRVFIEKYVSKPKHIEFQILRDKHGNTVHLFERECSVQRRHQKVVEEAPSPVMTQEVRDKMGQAAINTAISCDYTGAGTVEFILDENKDFYFLEMNTRLQVEHPVTEMITGVDLVEEQILIAEGKKIKFQQSDLKITGHSVEVRVYAEDPQKDFLPDTGKLSRYRTPGGKGVRVDDGFEEGMEVSLFYDPMIAKLITYDSSREKAINKMLRAIGEYEISGVITSLPFCAFVIDHPNFRDGTFTTAFVKEHWNGELNLENYESEAAWLAATLFNKSKKNKKYSGKENSTKRNSNWKTQRKR